MYQAYLPNPINVESRQVIHVQSKMSRMHMFALDALSTLELEASLHSCKRFFEEKPIIL
mgnify:CR=1 FL=1